MPQPTPTEVQAKMIALHHELSSFQFYLAHQHKPPKWNDDEVKAVGDVLEMVERETERIKNFIRQKEVDETIKQSLKDAGFEPDRT